MLAAEYASDEHAAKPPTAQDMTSLVVQFVCPGLVAFEREDVEISYVASSGPERIISRMTILTWRMAYVFEHCQVEV